ncbi:hypothetical protein VTI74DRAFT_3599 [Chaetomium olivicolor]
MGPGLPQYRRFFSRQRIPLPLVKEISKQLLSALSFLHDVCHVIHIDIKPQNILIETAATNAMFEEAPPEAFLPAERPLDPPNDSYMESSFSDAEEDLVLLPPADLRARLADFGACTFTH